MRNSIRITVLFLTNYLLCCSFIVHAESLYQEKTFRPIASDNRAFRVGDVLTVQVFENSSASTNSDTTTRRKNSISAGIQHDLGSTHGFGLDANGDFDGGGRTQRNGKLLAQLSVNVVEIFANGDMNIQGDQQLSINNEQQKIKLEGRVRQQDISDSNIVLSTRIADAKITYLGDGDLSERQKRGWWRKVLDIFGL